MNSIEYLKENKIEKGLQPTGSRSGPRPWPLRTIGSQHWLGLKALVAHQAADQRSGIAVVAHADRRHAPCARAVIVLTGRAVAHPPAVRWV
jgi:hypothetical protein